MGVGYDGDYKAPRVVHDCSKANGRRRAAKRQVRGGQPGAITGRHAPLVEKNIPADASKCQECACCCFWLLLVCSSKVINRQIN